ncbi:MAG TPA: hypothetical protein PKL82_05015 [Anaerolineaceae bacterium]|nr:hypothetical protein [Anaerolineaceae bacterium]NMD26537.1 hypothetical protein [Chloroflexota bacterium]HOA21829.1 hypothetical protein [Anaerolineaceae bacterium]HOG76809.1 hypothetical protein [Anaerolineaceae bacterium]
MSLTPEQEALIDFPLENCVFVHGSAGTGKTTAALHRLIRILTERPDEVILILLPQRVMGSGLRQGLEKTQAYNPGRVMLTTMNSIARRMVALFWPIISENAGFLHPYAPPHFLTLETSQFYMGKLVNPMLAAGAFSSVSIPRNRLYSQILDSVNKSALVGFPLTEIYERLSNAWTGSPAQLNVYRDVQTAANTFRDFCLENNLLDYSLQVELFRQFVWAEPLCQRFLKSSYQHLVYDNCEEDPPYVHDIISEWLPDFKSALLILDENAGYRRILGADPDSALRLKSNVSATMQFSHQHLEPQMRAFKRSIQPKPESQALGINHADVRQALRLPPKPARFFPEMLEQTAEIVQQLINEGTQPGKIAILAPYLPSAMGFAVQQSLSVVGIQSTVLRPSIPLIENPVVQQLTTLSQLAHPTWPLFPDPARVTSALSASIAGLDLVRAQLLCSDLLIKNSEDFALLPFAAATELLRPRIPPETAACYDTLRLWLEKTIPDEPLDLFISRLFGEVLTRPGFGYFQNTSAAQSTAILMESFRKFRLSLNPTELVDSDQINQDFIRTIQDGVIAAQYLRDWELEDESKVLITPALTFLSSGKTVDYQVWLSAGSSGWYERLEQPLTQPYVLSRNWPDGKKWTTEEEKQVSLEILDSILNGMLNRCRRGVILGLSEFGQSGQDEKGLLLIKIQNLLREIAKGGSNA